MIGLARCIAMVIRKMALRFEKEAVHDSNIKELIAFLEDTIVE